MPARHAIDLGPQFRDAILVTVLHLGLPRDQVRQDVIAKRKIGGRRKRPGRHDDQRANDDPEGDGSKSHLSSGEDHSVIGELDSRL